MAQTEGGTQAPGEPIRITRPNASALLLEGKVPRESVAALLEGKTFPNANETALFRQGKFQAKSPRFHYIAKFMAGPSREDRSCRHAHLLF